VLDSSPHSKAFGEKNMSKKRFSRPIAAGISSPSFARYGPKFMKAGVKLNTYRVALAALKAMYGDKAARAAIETARKVTKRKLVP
jgi:hypothetical protein